MLLAGSALFGLRGALGPGGLMLYVCGLFLVQEVLRRAFFDPVFLVLFQPLPAAERLQAHTLAKGIYEPLGMGLARTAAAADARRQPGFHGWAGWRCCSSGPAGCFTVRIGHYLGRAAPRREPRASPPPSRPLPGATTSALPRRRIPPARTPLR